MGEITIGDDRCVAARNREQLLAEAGGCGSPTCTDPDCSVAAGHCHRPGCGEKAAVPRMTNLKQRHVAGHPAMYCSRRCGGLARALPDLTPGRCGSPTCTAKRCTVAPGACHRPGCGNPAKVAPKTDRKQRWEEGRPILYCSRRCAGIVESEHAIGVHARDRAALELEGLVPTAKAALLAPRSQHRLYLVVDVERRKFGRRVRQAINARKLYDVAPDKQAARSQLAKPLALLNGNKPGPRVKLERDEIDRILEMAARGKSQRTIAAVVGVTHKQVRGVLARAGLGHTFPD